MTRYFKAKEKLGTYPNVKIHCPGNFQVGPFCDRETFISKNQMGCRGVSCFDCWNVEFDEGRDK